jgi:hypothetical protein
MSGSRALPRCHMCGDLPVIARLPDMVVEGLTTALDPAIMSLHVVMASLLVTRLWYESSSSLTMKSVVYGGGSGNSPHARDCTLGRAFLLFRSALVHRYLWRLAQEL